MYAFYECLDILVITAPFYVFVSGKFNEEMFVISILLAYACKRIIE